MAAPESELLKQFAVRVWSKYGIKAPPQFQYPGKIADMVGFGEYGAVLLMLLGTQWYILFNVIAGAMSLPNDLLEASDMLRLSGWKKWRTVILPGIFPQLVTGLITACGGAWNASIVAELAGWRDIDLTATGLGAYISQATAAGNWPDIVVGIMVMCLFVVSMNRFVWQRLYRLSAAKYHIG